MTTLMIFIVIMMRIIFAGLKSLQIGVFRAGAVSPPLGGIHQTLQQSISHFFLLAISFYLSPLTVFWVFLL